MTVAEALTLLPERSDAEVLLADLLGVDRTWLLAHSRASLNEDRAEAMRARATRRARGEPVAYITGKAPFYGRTFAVDRSVLIPRPSTECLVTCVLEYLEHPVESLRTADTDIVVYAIPLRDREPIVIADVGTGSGCIAITLTLEQIRPVIALDANPDALAIARANAVAHGVADRVRFLRGDLLSPLRNEERPFLLVSNPPYISSGYILPRDVASFEPHGALVAGPDGLSVLLPLLAQAIVHPACVGCVLECRADQVATLSATVRR